MGEALSYNSLGLYLGLTLGPPLGELLVRTAGFNAAWYGAASLALAAAIIVSGIGETRVARTSAEEPLRLIHRPAIAPSLGFFASIVAMGGFLAFASLHAGAVGLATASLPLIVYGSVVVLGRIAFAKIPDRLPPLPLGAAALVIIATGLTVLAIWHSLPGVLLGAGLLGLGVTFSTPAFFRAIFATANTSERGVAAGTASAFLDLGLGGGPILMGLMARSVGIPGAFGVAAAVALAGFAWTLHLSRGSPPPPRLGQHQ
jgi:predicted MFS family arabinose efflux permease